MGEVQSRNDNDLVPGMMVGEYEIEGVLGEGGMGKVYAATHPIIAKRAAVKVLHPVLSKDRGAVERFVQEARSVNQIGHPNIVDIFAFGSLADGRSYFVMEMLRGESLRQRMERGPLAMVDSLAILDTVALALEAAHEHDIVHRDLKPDNIFLVEMKGAAPVVKLLDFGIAKLLGAEGALTNKTRTGNLMGTPAYISPEQARGHAVDHRTDIYAFGGLAYEMISGELPFPSDNAADMIAQHLHGTLRPARELNPAVPADLDVLFARLLAKDAANRPTLEETRVELRRVRELIARPVPSLLQTSPSMPATVLRTYGTAPTVTSPPKSRPWLVAVIAALVAALGVTTFVLVRATRETLEPPPAPPRTEKMTPVAEPPRPVIEATKPPPPKPVERVAPPPVEPKPDEPAVVVQPPPTPPAINPVQPDVIKQHVQQRFDRKHMLSTGITVQPGSGSAPPAEDDDAPMRRK